MDEMKNRGGAPRGNQNARKHGLYSDKLPEGQRASSHTPLDLPGIDREIGIIRLKIDSIVTDDPGNSAALCKAVRLLDRLIRTRCLVETNAGSRGDARPSLAVRRYLGRLFRETT